MSDLRAALQNARSALTAFGGNPSELSEELAKECGVDMMQWALLRQIDEALKGEVPAASSADEVPLYLESHVTIEPVFDYRRDDAAAIAREFKFRLAELLMKKDRDATEVRSDKDTFMTGHSKSRSDIEYRTRALVLRLKECGFTVWRYKVEDTLVDSKHGGDQWRLP